MGRNLSGRLGAVALALVLATRPALTSGLTPRAATGVERVVLQLPYYHMFKNEGIGQSIADTYKSVGMAEPARSLDRFLYDPDPVPNYELAWWAGGIGASVLVLAAASGLWNVQLRRRVRERTEALHRNEQNLETIVNERTAELRSVNRSLQDEIASRVRAEDTLRDKTDQLTAVSETTTAFLDNAD